MTGIGTGTTPTADVVSKKVFINGAPLSGEISIAQITVNKSFNKIAYAKLVFQDGSAADREFNLSNDDLFKPGNPIKIQLGYQNSYDTVFEGIIIKHSIKVRQSGASLLMIEAKDKSIKLTGSRKSVYHLEKTDSAAISDAAQDLSTDIEPTTDTHKQLVQYDATDWDFIITRAEANGMLVLTDDGKIIVKKPSTSSPPVHTATFGDDIREFEAEMDARQHINQVTGQAWDHTSQQMEESDSGTFTFSENGNISSSDLGAVLEAEVKLNHSGYRSQAELQNWSNAYAMKNQLSKTSGRVRILGNAAIKPGTVITLAGVGDRFNGNVYVTGVLHHFEGAWQTDIQFGWKEEWFYQKEDVMEKPASGLLPGINGLQIGVVKSVDDTGNDGQYRVRVHVPTITSGNEGIWARVATLDAGANRGSYFRPEENDEVVLGFLNDDPRDAIVLGYLHSKDNKASPLPEEEGALQFGFVTKEGLKLIFDDTNKKMTLSTPGGAGDNTIIIGDSGSIEMKDENQNSIKMGADGITIEAGSGKNVTIKGTQVLIN